MGKFIGLNQSVGRNLISRFGRGKAVLQKPLAETRAEVAAKIMRFGTKGIRDQFIAQTEYRGALSVPWDRKRPFGTKSARGKTMMESGKYRAAWLGGPGGTESSTGNTVTLGVNREIFKQVAIHQGSAAAVTVKPKTKIRSGRNRGQWAMRFAIGMKYGVWMTNARIAKGFRIARRRLSLSMAVKKSVAAMVKEETRKAMRPGVMRVVR